MPSPLLHLNKYFYKYRGRLVAGVAFVAISNVFGIIPAKLIRYALDQAGDQIAWYRITRHFGAADGFVASISFNLVIFVGLVLLMALLKGLFMFFMRQTIIVVSRYIEYDLKNEIYDHYQRLDIGFYSVNNTGDLMNRISEDVGRVRMYAGPAIMYTVNLVVMFILVIYAMVRVNVELTLFTLLPLPLLSAMIYFVEDIINRKSELVQQQLAGLSTAAQEAFSGIRVIKAYNSEAINHKQFTRLSDQYKDSGMDLVRVNALFQPSLLLLIGLSTILTVFIGGLKAIDGSITIGNIAEFVIYVNMLTWPVASLGWVVSLVQRAAASQQRINEFLNTTPSVVSPTLDPLDVTGQLEFRNVLYTYRNSGICAVSGLSFRIRPGSSLAITGSTGSGKSTVAGLLLRLMDPDSGSILVDGRDLRTVNLGAYRSHTGYVPQEVFLFSDTVAGNIAFGLSNGRPSTEIEERVRQAAADADVLDNILEFPEGFQTRVGERGITLSGGQKQRISIARAIIRNPAILVFDDCLSAVDTRTEERILTALRRIMKGKTTVIISHRISSVRQADQILVLDQGKLVEQGNHDSLLAAGGIYAGMYEKQAIEPGSQPSVAGSS